MKKQKRNVDLKKDLKILNLCLDFNNLFKDKSQLCLDLLNLISHKVSIHKRSGRESQDSLNEPSLNTMKNVLEKALNFQLEQNTETSRNLLKSSNTAEIASKSA